MALLCSLPALASPPPPDQGPAQVLPRVVKLVNAPGNAFWQLKSHQVSASTSHQLLYFSPVMLAGCQSVSFQTLAVRKQSSNAHGTFQ